MSGNRPVADAIFTLRQTGIFIAGNPMAGIAGRRAESGALPHPCRARHNAVRSLQRAPVNQRPGERDSVQGREEIWRRREVTVCRIVEIAWLYLKSLISSALITRGHCRKHARKIFVPPTYRARPSVVVEDVADEIKEFAVVTIKPTKPKRKDQVCYENVTY